MKSLFDQLKNEPGYKSLSATYHIGLLQTKTYKAIMGNTSQLLSKSKLSNSEWVALGIIYDNSKGLRSLDLAEIMCIEQAYITVIVNKLVNRGYLRVSQDPTDKRAKIIHISKIGKLFVKKTEAFLSKEMRRLSAGIPVNEALIYFKVQKHIVKLSETMKE